ncbi:MAG: hypothetical protein ACRCWO_09045, partial [Bosea sp. (in: a-proteobacteria)]
LGCVFYRAEWPERIGANRADTLDAVAVDLAGRAAEIIVYGAPDSGSGGSRSSDLHLATRRLFQLHQLAGLGRTSALFWQSEIKEGRAVPLHIRRPIEADLREQEARAISILSESRGVLDALTARLVADRTMTGETFAAGFAPRIKRLKAPDTS